MKNVMEERDMDKRDDRLLARMIRFGTGAALALVCAAAFSQAYPTRAVRLIVPFPPGGGTDTMARVVAPKLSEYLGQQVVSENRGGAGANIGAELAAKSAPDGYTIMLATITNAIGASLYTKLNYDLVRDFSTITQLATTPHILVVHPSVPVKTVKEFTAFAKARPGDLAYSSSGAGSAAHLAGELFNSLTGVKGYEAGSWYGLSAPAGTPKEIVSRLHAETLKVVALPDVKERLFNAGFEVVTSNPEQFAAFTRSEIQKWGKIVKSAGLKAD